MGIAELLEGAKYSIYSICHCCFVAGHVDAGKSTLMGHLLYRLGDVSKKSMHKYPFQIMLSEIMYDLASS